MPNYVAKQLERYNHEAPSSPQYAPHLWPSKLYSKHSQLVSNDTSDLLDKKNTKLVQSISGAFLYYGRAVDPTILPALTDIASAQSKPTQHTLQACNMLMDYLHTNPNAKIRYTKSDMILYIDSDAAYLVLPKARSRIAGHFFLGNIPPSPPAKPTSTFNNGPILTVCKRLRTVATSAAEAETAATYHNSKEGIPPLFASLQRLDINNQPMVLHLKWIMLPLTASYTPTSNKNDLKPGTCGTIGYAIM